MRVWLTTLIVALAIWSFGGPLAQPASACPSCKVANDAANPNRPKAYMYSILFMMSVPAIIFASFGVGFYRLSKKNSSELGPLEDHIQIDPETGVVQSR